MTAQNLTIEERKRACMSFYNSISKSTRHDRTYARGVISCMSMADFITQAEWTAHLAELDKLDVESDHE